MHVIALFTGTYAKIFFLLEVIVHVTGSCRWLTCATKYKYYSNIVEGTSVIILFGDYQSWFVCYYKCLKYQAGCSALGSVILKYNPDVLRTCCANEMVF